MVYPAHAANGVAEKDRIRRLEVFEVKDSLLCGRICFEEVTAEDSGQDARAEGWGEEFASALDEEAADRAFGDFISLVQEKNLIETSGMGFGVEAFVLAAVGGLVAQENIRR